MNIPVRIAILPSPFMIWAMLCVMLCAAVWTPRAMAAAYDIHLHCEGEQRSRLLAFTAGELATEERQGATRRLRVEIRTARRASVIDAQSGEILFAPSQCRLTEMKLACESVEDDNHRQVFISRVSGDAVFEGYTETSNEKSALTVERYGCVKEDREPLF